MNWVSMNNTWLAEVGDLSFTVRWARGAWHWRAVYCDGALETAQFAGDNRKEHPNGFLTAEDAMRAAERWYEVLNNGTW